MSVYEQMHEAIGDEKILHNADGHWVTLDWIRSKQHVASMIGHKLIAFIIFEKDKSFDHIFIHMIWVDKKYRKKQYATKLLKILVEQYPGGMFWCYGNPRGRKLLESFGFMVGKTKYRECILNNRELNGKKKKD